jgi:hypothetical protein
MKILIVVSLLIVGCQDAQMELQRQRDKDNVCVESACKPSTWFPSAECVCHPKARIESVDGMVLCRCNDNKEKTK